MLQGCKVSDICRMNLLQPAFHHRKFAPQTMIRRDIRVSSSISSRIPDLSVSVPPAVDVSPQGLADRLRLGDLADDGFSYKERFIVRCYEVGVNRTATIETLANLLQEVACSHAQSVGFSTDGFATTNTMRKRNLIWVALRMHIEVYKYPAWADVVEIETWIQEEGRIGTRRDWVMKDFATDTVIGRATSKWVMMNVLTRRLERVTDDVRSELSVYCPQTTRFYLLNWLSNGLPYAELMEYVAVQFSGSIDPTDTHSHVQFGCVGWTEARSVRANLPVCTSAAELKTPPNESFPVDIAIMNRIHACQTSDGELSPFQLTQSKLAFPEEDNRSLRKIPMLDDPAQHLRTGLMSMPQEVLDTHELQTITLDYRRECQREDQVDSLTSFEADDTETAPTVNGGVPANGSVSTVAPDKEGLQFLHLLRLSGQGLEINRGRTVWRRKTAHH